MTKIISFRRTPEVQPEARPPESKKTIAVLPVVREYLAAVKGNLQPRTHTDYRLKLTVFAAWCDASEVSLDRIERTAVSRFVEHIRTTHHSQKAGHPPVSSHTLACYVRTIKACLNWLATDVIYGEIVKEEIVRRIEMPPTEKMIVTTFSDEQIRQMLRASRQEESEHMRRRAAAVIALLIGTGIRASELLGLTMENTVLSQDKPYIKVFGKGRKERIVPMGQITVLKVQHYVDGFRRDALAAAPLFLDRTQEKALGRDGLDGIIKRLGHYAGIEGVRLSAHTFRHSYSKNFMSRGGNIYHLSKILGHTGTGVTEHYLRDLGTWDLYDQVQAQLR